MNGQSGLFIQSASFNKPPLYQNYERTLKKDENKSVWELVMSLLIVLKVFSESPSDYIFMACRRGDYSKSQHFQSIENDAGMLRKSYGVVVGVCTRRKVFQVIQFLS